jgi:putative intracellular protease/amidase
LGLPCYASGVDHVGRGSSAALEAAEGPRIAFDGVRFLDVVGPLEVFTVANEQGDFYSAQVATLGGRDVVTTTGNRLGADVTLEDVDAESFDTVLVAGSPNWSLLLAPELVREVARVTPQARRVVSVCTGTFALAAAGLLDGKRAATHWRHAAALHRQFPVGCSASRMDRHWREMISDPQMRIGRPRQVILRPERAAAVVAGSRSFRRATMPARGARRPSHPFVRLHRRRSPSRISRCAPSACVPGARPGTGW